MNYAQTLHYLYDRLPVFHRIGAAALKPGLDNIRALCAALGNPHEQFKSIHVAGTNGKGSTSHLLAAVLQSAGYKTGLHTSPHLKHYGERFKINGQNIPEADIVAFVAAHVDLIEQIKPSFFEISVALAFDYFARQRVDVAVIEVGLGGRLDSTNIITPDLSIITNISFDHTELLGDTLEKIAFEKAGIIKKGVPVVISETQPETAPVFQNRADELQSKVYFADKNYRLKTTSIESGGREVVVSDALRPLHHTSYTLHLLGAYQLKNLTGVLQAVDILRQMGYQISDEALQTGVSQAARLTQLKGRWQTIGQAPTTVADVAHNYAGLKESFQQINRYSFDKLHVVLGFVKDKDLDSIFKLLPRQAHYYCCAADSPRSLPATDLLYLINKEGMVGSLYSDVNQALASAREKATAHDFIYVGGSTFVVSELDEV
ncbi:MAG: bifunctional folylpolyglutamate synthase/dihydrofolate synthase [Runella slithyformis]|nr:MAG: bifunctional folylpolyglutamate synthase/dihydrofolate synthase [Runella slithyformis]